MRLDEKVLRMLLASQEKRECRVRIRTKEKCPKCKGSFSETPLGLICLKCKTVPRRFYIYLSWKGRKLKIYSFRDGQPLSSWELAKRAQELITHEIESGIFDPSRWVKSDLRDYFFSVRLEDYLSRKARELKPSALKVKRIWLKKALEVIGDMDVREIRAAHIERFKQVLEESHASPKTVKNALGELHAFFRDLARLEYIPKVPTFPSIKAPDPIIRYLEPETLALLLEHVPEEHRDIFLFMFLTGCRPGEARALMWDCVNFREEIILIKRTFSDYKLVEIPKENDWKTLPMVEPIRSILERRAREKRSLFVFEHKRRGYNTWTHYSDRMLRRVYREACEKAGIKNPPTLYQAVRHSAAMDLLNAGYSYEAIARLLGHKHITTTRRYGKLKTETVRPLLEHRARIVNLSDYREKRRQTNSE